MMLRRFALCLAAAGLTVGAAGVVPAAGAAGSSGTITGVTTTEKDGTVHTQWSVQQQSTVRAGTVTATWSRSGTQPIGTVAPAPNPQTGPGNNPCTSQTSTSWTCDYPWPFFQDPQHHYVPNGVYTLTATATATCLVGCSDPSPATMTNVVVANSPVAPTHVAAAVVSDPTEVKITWDPNPEPDLFGYAVFRLRGSTLDTPAVFECSVGPKTKTPCPDKLSAIDDSSGGGKFSYRVEVYRWGKSWDIHDTTSATATSSAVTVPGPPATTTTTAAGSTNNSDTGAFAVFGSGNSSSGGSTSSFTPSFSGRGSANSVDRGYSTTLPFGVGAGADQATGPDRPAQDGPTIKTPVASHTKHSVGRIALGATSLLLLVLAMLGLWLRQQVKHAGVLEPLDPEM
jgi:hypothetical protein